MWGPLISGATSSVAGGLGYTAATGAAVEGLILVNQHVFLPLLEKSDIYLTKKIFGEEEAMKTEQDWISIKTDYINPVLGVVSLTNKTLLGEAMKKEAENPEISYEPIGSFPNLVYSKEGSVRDISKVGPAGSEAKLESDETKYTPPTPQSSFKSREQQLAASMVTPGFVPYLQKYEAKNPLPSDLTKRMLKRLN